MNDRAISALEHYDMEVQGVSKGRGSLICTTDKGIFVLKEYQGSTDKLELLDTLQGGLEGRVRTDRLVRTRENEPFSKDTDGVTYLLKEHIEGRECSYKSEEDIRYAFSTMARLHIGLEQTGRTLDCAYAVRETYADELVRHTRECRHIRNYLRRLKRKSAFERELLARYDYFLEKAEEISALSAGEERDLYARRIEECGCFCHGDYQYHNVIFGRGDISVINFEHFTRDSGVRDLYLLFRKISEKNGWQIGAGQRMLDAYERLRPLDDWERRQLAYRLAYPDKFWKIANHYYNSRKSRIPDKQVEKLATLCAQEDARLRLLHKIFEI